MPILLIAGTTLLAVMLTSLIVLFRYAYQDRITPGVYVYRLDLGGMTQEEAVAAVSAYLTYPNTAIFTFRDNNRFWQMSAGELGFSFDVSATVEQALSIGNGDGLINDLTEQARIWFRGHTVAPIAYYDQNVALECLLALAREIDNAPTDAVLYVDGMFVTAIPGQAGRTLDIEETLARLNNSIQTLTPGGEIPLAIDEVQPTMWNADEAASWLRAALSGPLTLVADGPNGEHLGPWTIGVEQIAALLTVEIVQNPDGTRNAQVGVDMSVYASELGELAPGLVVYPRNGRFHFNDDTGELEVIQPAVAGRELNAAETIARLEEAVFRYDSRDVPVAFSYVEPRYHNNVTAAELGITQMVVEATTYFTGSGTNRRHNIAEAASRFDGVIIGPGEEFSFNYWLGDVSLETGFLESKVIEGERTTDGIGGGICQVSTTAFRAAFYGGYFIIERNSHAYRVGFYELNGTPPGLDAAIWTPERDFRFQNDTPYPLLIETSVYPANNALQFRFYSANPGRSVEIQSPIIRNPVPPLATAYEVNPDLQLGEAVQVDWAAAGADVTVFRIIRDADGSEIRRDSIYTHYLPWRAVIQVAPGDARLAANSGN